MKLRIFRSVLSNLELKKKSSSIIKTKKHSSVYPLFFGKIEIVGVKSWEPFSFFISGGEPPVFRIPQNFGNRNTALILSGDFRYLADIKDKKLHILGKIRIFNDYKTINFSKILFFQNKSHVFQVFFIFRGPTQKTGNSRF